MILFNNNNFNSNHAKNLAAAEVRFQAAIFTRGGAKMAENTWSDLPAWNDKLLPMNVKEHIFQNHTLKGCFCSLHEYGGRDCFINPKFADKSFKKIKESITAKLESGAGFNKTENEVVMYLEEWGGKEYFPHSMSEKQIIKAIQDAYIEAAKRSK
jgi:hypothetical protein